MEKYLSLAKQYGTKGILYVQVHSVFLFILVFSGMSAYLVVRSGQLISSEPTESQISEKQLEIKAINVDTEGLQAVESLTARDIELQSNFVNRDNPFEN